VPSFTQLNRALKLDAADQAVVKSALAQWAQSAHNQNNHTGADTSRSLSRRPEMEFVAAVAPSLDKTQLTGLVGLLTSRRSAQRDGMRPRGEDRRGGERDSAQAVATELGLTEKQRDQLRDLRKETRARADAQRTSLNRGDISEDQMRDALHDIHEDARARMTTILTPDQLKKLDSMRDERVARGMERHLERADSRGDAQVEWLTRTLQLSGAQASSMRVALVKLADAQKSALKGVEDGSLTRDQSGQRMRTAHDAYTQSLKGILTPEQNQRMEILKPLLPGRIHHAR